jgi:hypothetical protein
MLLKTVITFQKVLALAAAASNRHEAEAAELAARRLMEEYDIDPIDIPDASFYDHMNFADNAVLRKLRDEYRAPHARKVAARLARRKAAAVAKRKATIAAKQEAAGLNTRPKPTATPGPVNWSGLFDDFAQSIADKCEPVNTPKPSLDR